MGLAAAAGITAVGAIGASAIGSHAASKATKAQTAANQAGLAEQGREFDINQANFAPWLATGKQALGGQSDLLGLNGGGAQQTSIDALKASPLYQSLFRNGQDTILNNASATGGLRGGNLQRSLADFGSDTLAQVIQGQLANLGGLSGQGLSGAGGLGGLNAGSANSISQLYQNQGSAQASGALAQGGIAQNTIANLTQSLGGLFGGSGGGQSFQQLGLPGYGLSGGAALPFQSSSPW